MRLIIIYEIITNHLFLRFRPLLNFFKFKHFLNILNHGIHGDLAKAVVSRRLNSNPEAAVGIFNELFSQQLFNGPVSSQELTYLHLKLLVSTDYFFGKLYHVVVEAGQEAH